MTSPEPPPTQREALATFTRFPVGAVGTLLVLAAVGVLALVSRLGTVAQPFCQGALMSPGDVCERRGRRGRGRFEVDYDRVLGEATGNLLAQRSAAVVVVVIALTTCVLLIVRRWRDLTLAASFAGEQPLVVHAERTAWKSVVAVVIASLAALVGLLAGMRFLIGGTIASVLGWVTLAATAAAVLFLVIRFRPRGSEYVGVYLEGVRLARRGAVRSVPWLAVHHYPVESGQDQLGVVGEKGLVTLDRSVGDQVRIATTQTWTSTALARLEAGETLDFGDLTLSRTAITADGVAIPLGELAAISHLKDKDGLHLALTTRDGRIAAKVNAHRVPNTEALDVVLGWLLHIRVPSIVRTQG